jgi:hypothetical protein
MYGHCRESVGSMRAALGSRARRICISGQIRRRLRGPIGDNVVWVRGCHSALQSANGGHISRVACIKIIVLEVVFDCLYS